MGFFGTYLYAGDQWTEHDPDQPVNEPGPWLRINIHDSDFTIVTYSPEYEGTGVAYLGYTPRMYFESEDDSRTNPAQEAAALTTWWTNHTPTADPTTADSKRAELLPYLAEDKDTFDEDEDEEDDEDLPDAEIYVEVKTADFLTSLNLPLPPALEQLLA
ncbi:hypothetical protein GCM10009554_07010 [Kribbella koreensis]|uniref:Uncharacterized protein n=1 Tax=Kribbella koreensis TaxID=57909 RepID=A0ABN1PDV3_9ACTN